MVNKIILLFFRIFVNLQASSRNHRYNLIAYIGDKWVKETKPRSLPRAGFQESIPVAAQGALCFRLFPERAGLADFFHALDHLTGVFMYA
jgi:hypothetical protein